MNDTDEENCAPGSPWQAPPEKGMEAEYEEGIARLLRLAGPRLSADPERSERVMAVVQGRWRAEVRTRRRFKRWIAIPVAAAIALVTIVGVAQWLARVRKGVEPKAVAVLVRVQGPLRFSDGGNVREGAELRPGVGISTVPGGRAALRLSTEASLRLDSNTTLRLVSDTVLDLEQGAIYVDSHGAKGAAVTVHTPTGVVRDIGTQFEVRLVESGLHVTVREGAASLGLRDGAFEIQAGTRLTAGARGGLSRTAVPPNSPDWDWVLEIAPPFHSEGKTLGDLLAWVCRETGWQVRFADITTEPERASIVLHGSVEGMRPDEASEAFLPTCGLTSHLEGNVLVIKRLDTLEGSP
jgi:ferric-dicitrate binding protein FerR (iron transport regulator)